MAKRKKIFWAVMVGPKSIAYPMDGKLFEKKRDAVALKRENMPCNWSHHWRIAKLSEDT